MSFGQSQALVLRGTFSRTQDFPMLIPFMIGWNKKPIDDFPQEDSIEGIYDTLKHCAPWTRTKFTAWQL
jgi:hypothetical protein